MLTGELLNHFRMKLTVMGLPPLIDPVLITYLNNAYIGFVNLMGGAPDEEDVVVTTGSTDITLPSYVLKIKSAMRDDGKFVEIINRADTRNPQLKAQVGVPGEVKYLIIGTKPNSGRVAYSPVTDITLTLDIERLPKTPLSAVTDDIVDVGDVWQLNLLDSATSQVMQMNPDPSIRSRSQDLEARFVAAATQARKEKARGKSKQVRAVKYGGIL